MSVTPRLIARYTNSVDLSLRTRAGIKGYRIAGADTLDTAFAGATAMFTVPAARTFRSLSIRKRNEGNVSESNRGLTRMMYDPEDYWVPGGDLPHDPQVSYITVEEQNAAGTFLPPGPVFIVPPPGFFSNPRPSLTLTGTAPSVTVPATKLPPPDAMHIVLPRFCDNIRIQNLSSSDPLLVSFNEGQTFVSIATESVEIFYDAAFSDLILCGDGASIAFDARCAIVNGEMA
ncbi:hypothetical protein N9917_03170 [Deltaproteobacteria bacterium]|nr:hypothetical protein [Deltaproteobacteria bacterium]